MLRPKLVVTTRYPPAIEERLERDFDVRRGADGVKLSRLALLELSGGADAMFITPMDRLDAEFFKHVSSSVKVIATYSVGLDHVDLKAAAARKIAIGYTPGANADATAEIAILLMLGAARRAYEAEEMLRSGAWAPNPKSILGWQLTEKTLGIFGMGKVGQAVARRAAAFGMKIRYVNPSKLSGDLVGDAVYHATLDEMLPNCQFLSLHAPETEKTRHIINSRTLAMLPKGAILINTARGGLVVDTDLIAALKGGHIAAAGLDVYDGEPNLNTGYLELQNTFLLPHLGSATIETRTKMGMICLDNIQAVLEGNAAPSLASA